jgi:phage antirepressor YoqD-like protein
MENQIVKVGFHGGEIEAVKVGNDVWVSVRRICENLGIDPKNQQEKLSQKRWASCKVLSTSQGQSQCREQFMLHLDSVPMWLANIDSNRVAEDARGLLDAYQLEATKVLRDHFYGKIVHTPQDYIEALEETLRLAKENKLLQDKNKRDEPYVAVGEAFMVTDGACLIRDFCKSVIVDGRVIGQNRMFAFLREVGILMPDNRPFQKHVDAGRFRVRQDSRKDRGGKLVPCFTTMITPKGEGYVVNIIKRSPLFANMSIVVVDRNK